MSHSYGLSARVALGLVCGVVTAAAVVLGLTPASALASPVAGRGGEQPSASALPSFAPAATVERPVDATTNARDAAAKGKLAHGEADANSRRMQERHDNGPCGEKTGSGRSASACRMSTQERFAEAGAREAQPERTVSDDHQGEKRGLRKKFAKVVRVTVDACKSMRDRLRLLGTGAAHAIHEEEQRQLHEECVHDNSLLGRLRCAHALELTVSSFHPPTYAEDMRVNPIRGMGTVSHGDLDYTLPVDFECHISGYTHDDSSPPHHGPPPRYPDRDLKKVKREVGVDQLAEDIDNQSFVQYLENVIKSTHAAVGPLHRECVQALSDKRRICNHYLETAVELASYKRLLHHLKHGGGSVMKQAELVSRHRVMSDIDRAPAVHRSAVASRQPRAVAEFERL